MKNWMNQELSEAEKGLVDVYHNLLGILRDHRGELQPFEDCNARKALGTLWQIVNGLDLDPDQLYDIHV